MRPATKVLMTVGLVVNRTSTRTPFVCAPCRALSSSAVKNANTYRPPAPSARIHAKRRRREGYLRHSPRPVGKNLLNHLDTQDGARQQIAQDMQWRLPAWKIGWAGIEALMRWMYDNQDAKPESFRQALEQLKIPIEAVLPLSRAMINNNDPWTGFAYFGRELIHKASEAGNSDATCFLLSSALKYEQYTAPELKPVIAEAERLSAEQQDVRASILLALLHKERGEVDEALRLLQHAIDAPEKQPSDQEDVPEEVADLHLGRALRELGTMHLEEGNREAAKKVWQRAAEEGGDPQAYAYLTSLAPKYSKEWYHYTLKAATGAHLRSIHQLALLYVSCVDEKKLLALKDPFVRAEIEHIANEPIAEQGLFKSLKLSYDRFFGSEDPQQTDARQLSLLRYARMWLMTAAHIRHVPSLLTMVKIDWDLGLLVEASVELGVATLEGADNPEEHPDSVEEFRQLRQMFRQDADAEELYQAWLKRNASRGQQG